MKHEFRASKLHIASLLISSVFIVPGMCWFLWETYKGDEYSEFMAPILVAYGVFYMAHGVEWAHRLSRPDLALVVDEHGIFDPRSMSRPIPWQDIEAINSKTVRGLLRGPKFANLNVKDPARFRNKVWRVWFLLRAWRRWDFNCDFSIGFTELNGDIDDFLEAAAQSGQKVAVDALEAYRQHR